MENPSDPNVPQLPSQSGPPMTYVLLVGVLLVVIIASLAVLWSRERSRRIAAERKASQIRMQYDKLRKAVGTVNDLRSMAPRIDKLD